MSEGRGFFPELTVRKAKKAGREGGTRKILSCASCGMYQYVLSPRMEPFGNFKKRILNIGEAPGEEEDKKGKQWQGKVGQRLQREYRELGFDLFDDCLNINSVNCRPVDKKGNNRAPVGNEVDCCRSRVLKVIEENSPHVIILVGEKALQSIIGNIWTKDLGGVSKWRGFTIPDRSLNAWICPVWHPSFVERQSGATEIETVWRQDLERALKMSEVPLPEVQDEAEQVQILDPDQVETFLSRMIRRGVPFAFDYETTGLKPHAEGHQIVCVSVCYSEDRAFVFEMPEKGSRAEQLWKELLSNPAIPKWGYNMKYEHQWTHTLLETEIQGWEWDGMLAAHMEDNRPGICSLKFQTYIRFGVAGYDSSIEKYLKGTDPKDGNSLNRVPELWADRWDALDQMKREMWKNLLIYCGMDSLFTYRLAQLQRRMLT